MEEPVKTLMSVLWEDIHVVLVRTVTTPLDPIAVWSIVEQASEELLMGSAVKILMNVRNPILVTSAVSMS